MALSLPGLASNLDTQAIIKALMDVHAIPRTLLSAKKDDKNFVISQLQSLNTSMQDLATKASAAARPEAFSPVLARASSDALTATAHPTASPFATDIVVDRLAQAHTVVTAAFSGWPDDPPVLTIENAAGERVQVTAASTSAADIARALTDAGVGISAVAVPAGFTPGDAPQHRLQITADETGAAGAFRVYRGDLAAVQAGLAPDLAAEPGAALLTAGADAQVRLWAGTPAEQIVTSASNTLTDLFPGVDVTVARVSAEPVTLTVAPDAAARAKTVGAFVTEVAGILARIAKGSTATVGGAPGETTTLGVFTGDSTVRALHNALTAAAQHPVDGVSPSTIGISVDKNGVLTFDEEKFTAAVTADPDAAAAVFAGVATRVDEVGRTYSDKYDGLLTARITGQESEVRALGEQMERWDVRLAQRRATLERTYARLEVMLSQMQAQSSYLESQLANLPSMSGSQK